MQSANHRKFYIKKWLERCIANIQKMKANPENVTINDIRAQYELLAIIQGVLSGRIKFDGFPREMIKNDQ